MVLAAPLAQAEDELIYMLEGEVVLCEDGGETVLKPGDAAGWKADVAQRPLPDQPRRRATRSISRSARRAARDRASYPDIDMVNEKDETGVRYLHKSGEPYPRLEAE